MATVTCNLCRFFLKVYKTCSKFKIYQLVILFQQLTHNILKHTITHFPHNWFLKHCSHERILRLNKHYQRKTTNQLVTTKPQPGALQPEFPRKKPLSKFDYNSVRARLLWLLVACTIFDEIPTIRCGVGLMKTKRGYFPAPWVMGFRENSSAINRWCFLSADEKKRASAQQLNQIAATRNGCGCEARCECRFSTTVSNFPLRKGRFEMYCAVKYHHPTINKYSAGNNVSSNPG